MISLNVQFDGDNCSVEKMDSRCVLPTEVRPVHYAVHLTPSFETFEFQGEVTIELNVLESVDQIQLNSADIQFIEATVTQENVEPITVSGDSIVTEEKDGVSTIPAKLQAGSASLTIKFTGEMNDKLKGFYRSRYTDGEGKEHLIGTTQFEPVDARRAFPCWDEPAAKATFTVTLTVPDNLLVLSNMPEVSSTPADGLKTVVFDKSPIMSTYLLAWVIGDFEHVETHTKNGTLVRVFAPIGKKKQVEWALEVASKVLPYFEEYFEIPFPLPKSDLIAIPDFSAGAMENWGLVTYREVAVLYDPESSSASQKEYTSLVIAHELAHQWFGNLVTMEWWSQLWLNEGFACFIEYLAVDYLYPEWQMWTEFVGTETTAALGLDGLKNSHPIEVEIDHPSKIDEIFDRISYSKGACVIRMIQSYLGPETFRKALVKYLNHFKYSNAVTTDLWRFLSEESGKDVNGIMDNWTKKQGYPVISIEENGDSLTLRQNRFLSSGPPTEEEDSTIWSVPILIQVGGSEDSISVLLDEREMKIDLPADASFYKLNLNATGVYRVKYDQKGLENLSAAIRSKELSAIDRVNVLSDSLAMAKAGVGSTCDTLTLLSAYAEEDDLNVWSTVAGALGAIKKLVTKAGFVDEFNAFAQDLFSKIFVKLGWEEQDGDSHRDKQLRAMVVGAMAGFKHPETVQEALKRFEVFVANKTGIPNDLKGAVYMTAARNGGEKEYEQLKQIYEASGEPRDRIQCLRSLGAVPDTEILKKTLDYGMSDKVRNQDAIYGVCPVAENPKGTEIAWTWLQEHWVELSKMFPAMGFMGRFAKMTMAFLTLEKADEVEAFFKTQDCTGSERAIQQALETIRLNARWYDRDAEAIGNWLKEKSKL